MNVHEVAEGLAHLVLETWSVRKRESGDHQVRLFFPRADLGWDLPRGLEAEFCEVLGAPVPGVCGRAGDEQVVTRRYEF